MESVEIKNPEVFANVRKVDKPLPPILMAFEKVDDLNVNNEIICYLGFSIIIEEY